MEYANAISGKANPRSTAILMRSKFRRATTILSTTEAKSKALLSSSRLFNAGDPAGQTIAEMMVKELKMKTATLP